MIRIKKQTGKDFVILNLTDPQLCNVEWNEGQAGGAVLRYTVDELVRRVKPDLITVTGDLAWQSQVDSYDKFTELLEGYKTPWTFILGNHDNDGGAERACFLASRISSHSGCLFEAGDAKMGCGNFVILIEEEGHPSLGLILFDTHVAHFEETDIGEIETDDGLNEHQVSWYREQVEELKRLGCRESAVFMHIPLSEFKTAYKEALAVPSESLTIGDSFSPDTWNDGYKDSFGVNKVNTICYKGDDGFFDLICELGSTKTIICGHEHINSAAIRYRGIRLVYGLKTGLGWNWDPAMSGGTVITVGSDGVKEIRHEFVDAKHLL